MGAVQFWSIATLMIVATTAILVVPLFWRGAGADVSLPVVARRRWFAFGTAAGVPLFALTIYSLSGEPQLIDTRAPPVTDVATLHSRAALAGKGANGGDLDEAVDRLRTRLATHPDDADGWRLLAQSYDFQGRTQEAADARKRAEAAGGGRPSSPSVSAPKPDAESDKLAQSAEEHRRRREFSQAIADFAALAKRGGMSADQWADYADALGGAHGKLEGDAQRCIDQALALDPDHPKALWLLGSLQTQRSDYAAAAGTWEHLANVLPPDSPDRRIIAANLDEARGKVTRSAPMTKTATAATPIVLRGNVRLDPRWRNSVPANAVLFVFARAADERGPPLAVLRVTAGSWPFSFTLDDRDAMMADRKLSDFTRVVVEARISRSGNALAQAGDLRGVSAVLDPRATGPLQLTISEQVAGATPPPSLAKGG